MDPDEDCKEDSRKENLSEKDQVLDEKQCREFRALFRGAIKAAPKEFSAGNRRNTRKEYSIRYVLQQTE